MEVYRSILSSLLILRFIPILGLLDAQAAGGVSRFSSPKRTDRRQLRLRLREIFPEGQNPILIS
jgi:hypothetical protein